MNFRNSADVLVIKILSSGLWGAGWRGGLTKFKKQIPGYRLCAERGDV